MNENINLTKILKNCQEGTKFWSDNFGRVEFVSIEKNLDRPIIVRRSDGYNVSYTKEGWCNINFPASCLLWPSKDSRDWSKFIAPSYKKEKFDPKTLKPFDKVLVKCTSIYNSNLVWRAELFSYFYVEDNSIRVYTLGSDDNSPKLYVIPYNDDTKHLVNTEIEAPEFYRYWED